MTIDSFYAKRIIEGQVKENKYTDISENFKKYQKSFYWTNENIACYLGMVNLRNCENALCVASSGDHIYELIAKGIKNIDTFDINKLTEYYSLGLKKAMILSYDYYNFLEVMNLISLDLPIDYLTDILRDLLPCMEQKYRKFWQEIIEYNYKIQTKYNTNLNLIKMLYIGTDFPRMHINNCYYLLDEYCYRDFKSKLRNANLTFKNVDALELPEHFKNKKYDVILLSNILDYANTTWGENWDVQKLKDYLKSLEGITKENGIIFYKYILSYLKEGIEKEKIFHNSSIKKEEINDEFYIMPKSTNTNEEDAIILRRVKFDTNEIL